MAQRPAQVLLGTFIRAGVLCLAAAGRTCIAHGLPAAPDTLSFTPLSQVWQTAQASTSIFTGGYIESWDGVSVVFQNCFPTGSVNGYLRVAVEASIIQ